MYIQKNPEFSEVTKYKWIHLIREISKDSDIKYFDYVYINGFELGNLIVKLTLEGRLGYLDKISFFTETSNHRAGKCIKSNSDNLYGISYFRITQIIF